MKRSLIYAIAMASVLVLSAALVAFYPQPHMEYPRLGDVSPPSISLISPANGSFIGPGLEIRLNISDENLAGALYTYGNRTYPLNRPWTIDTSSWGEGKHIIGVKAWDGSNNTASAYFVFFIDLTPPEIELVSPPNGSAMESGTIILLNITDEHLMGANYSLDGGYPQCLPPPFRINTEWWTEGQHVLSVSAMDMGGNTAHARFEFFIDNKETSIRLISPSTRVVRSGTPLVFDIEEETLENISYSINGGEPIPWSAPWTIRTDGWDDGTYSITIMATDRAGHRVIRTYTIDIDNTPPEIQPPERGNITVEIHMDEMNYSFKEDYDRVELGIVDDHLKDVLYSIDGGMFRELPSPYVLDPSTWRGRRVNISVMATDAAGNRAELNFSMNLTFELNIHMGTGWSDISIPLLLDTYSIREVFSGIENTTNGSYDKILSYDGTWHSFDPNRPDQFNLWKEFSPYYGLSIDITSQQANFTVSGALPRNMSLNLSSEHPNFMAYPYMKPMRVDRALQNIPWYRVQRWDWKNQTYVDMKGDDIMIPGYAYWIYVSYSSVWTVDFCV